MHLIKKMNELLDYAHIEKICVCPMDTFCRVFSAISGFTFKEYFTRRKLSEAVKDLKDTTDK